MDKIVILDCGGQYSHLIATRIRRLGVYSEIKLNDTLANKLKNYKGIIISGGPQSVYEKNSPQMDPEVFNLNIPILGICYGHQLIAHTLGGKIKSGNINEYGLTSITKTAESPIFNNFGPDEIVWMSHGDEIKEPVTGFKTIFSSINCQNAALANDKKRIYSVQFHPEVTHTVNGQEIFKNFLEICHAQKEWNLDDFWKDLTKEILDQVGDRNVFMLTSGGVDSTVAFVVLSKILGADRVYGLFVDTGLMRLNERQEVENSLKDQGFKNFHIADEKTRYLDKLKNSFDPEEKRQIIGDLFIDIQQEYADKLKLSPDKWLLGQGTIYPDTIESGGTKHASKIKTHHNRVPQIMALIEKGLVIEPLKDLYKDEVRALGEKLDIPPHLVWRHPFPGPGLGVRILCSKKALPVSNEAEIITEIRKNYGLDTRILPLKSVGVQGDARTYRHPLAIFPSKNNKSWTEWEIIATDITNRYPEVNRIILALNPYKSPQNIDINTSPITAERIQILQNIDAKVTEILRKHKLMRTIWQFPVVLLPVTFNNQSSESIVLRPVSSEEAMTANFSKIDWEIVDELKNEILLIEKLSGIFYDLTNKPPGTIEWE